MILSYSSLQGESMFIYYTMSPSPPSCRPPIRLIVKKKKGLLFGPLNELKIAEQEVCG